MKLVSFLKDKQERFGIAIGGGVADVGQRLATKHPTLGAALRAGALDTYWDPDRATEATATFTGRITGDDEHRQGLLKMAAGNTLFLNRGTSFERVAGTQGGIGASWAWAPALFDIDLDGRLDIYCCSGYVTGDTAADT